MLPPHQTRCHHHSHPQSTCCPTSVFRKQYMRVSELTALLLQRPKCAPIILLFSRRWAENTAVSGGPCLTPDSLQENGCEVPDCWCGGPSGGCGEPATGGVHGPGDEKHTSSHRPLLLKGGCGCRCWKVFRSWTVRRQMFLADGTFGK